MEILWGVLDFLLQYICVLNFYPIQVTSMIILEIYAHTNWWHSYRFSLNIPLQILMPTRKIKFSTGLTCKCCRTFALVYIANSNSKVWSSHFSSEHFRACTSTATFAEMTVSYRCAHIVEEMPVARARKTVKTT